MPEVYSNTGSDTVQITGTVTVTKKFLFQNGTLRLFKGTGSGSSQTLGTVTSGKTAYLVSLAAGNGTAGLFQVLDTSGNGIVDLPWPTNGSVIAQGEIPLCSWASGESMKVACTSTRLYTVGVIEI